MFLCVPLCFFGRLGMSTASGSCPRGFSGGSALRRTNQAMNRLIHTHKQTNKQANQETHQHKHKPTCKHTSHQSNMQQDSAFVLTGGIELHPPVEDYVDSLIRHRLSLRFVLQRLECLEQAVCFFVVCWFHKPCMCGLNVI